MVGLEALVVRAVPGAMDVQQGDHQAGAGLIPSHPAGGLDVLRRGLRLAQDHHEPQAADVEAYRDHVRGGSRPRVPSPQIRVSLRFVSATRSVVSRDVARHFSGDSRFAARLGFVHSAMGAEVADTRSTVFTMPGCPEPTEVAEVADERHERVCNFDGFSPPPRPPFARHQGARGMRSRTTFRLRPCAPPRRAGLDRPTGSRFREERRARFGPGGGNTSTPDRANSARILSDAPDRRR